MKMEKIVIKIFIVSLIFLFFNPFYLMGDGKNNTLGLHHIDFSKECFPLDTLDQYQENDNGYEKIYGGICYAQSFIPSRGILTQFGIKIGIDYNLPWFIELVIRLASWFPFLEPLMETLKIQFMNEPSNLIISLYDSEDGFPGESFYREEVTFSSLSLSNSWYNFSLHRHEIIPDNDYFIVLQAYGGDANTYFTWGFGDNNPYGLGTAMVSTDDGVTWAYLSSTDFCFRVYSESTGEEPDGIVNRWGVICGIDGDQHTVGDDSAVKIYNQLCSHGWIPSHIRLIKNEGGTKKDVLDAISWMDAQEDADDVVLFYFCGHGASHGIGVYPYPSGFLSGWELDAAISELGSRSLVMIFDCCNSGGLQQYLGKDNRVLLMSSQSDETSEGDIKVGSGYFTYYLIMGLGGPVADSNHNKWISAEEVFYYAAPKTTIKATYPQHPQIYDAWPSIQNNHDELDLISL